MTSLHIGKKTSLIGTQYPKQSEAVTKPPSPTSRHDDGNGTINNQSASVEGLEAHLRKTGQSFSFAAAKATLLNTALNSGIFLVASLAIQGIAKTFDNYIHRVDNARNRTDELFSEFRQMNDTLDGHKNLLLYA